MKQTQILSIARNCPIEKAILAELIYRATSSRLRRNSDRLLIRRRSSSEQKNEREKERTEYSENFPPRWNRVELARSECNGAKDYHTQRRLASSQLHRLVTGLSITVGFIPTYLDLRSWLSRWKYIIAWATFRCMESWLRGRSLFIFPIPTGRRKRNPSSLPPVSFGFRVLRGSGEGGVSGPTPAIVFDNKAIRSAFLLAVAAEKSRKLLRALNRLSEEIMVITLGDWISVRFTSRKVKRDFRIGRGGGG